MMLWLARDNINLIFGISDTLQIIVDNSNPTIPNQALAKKSKIKKKKGKYGKVNKRIVKQLLKVVIDDIEYEITSISEYLSFLKLQINRLERIDEYHNQMENANSERSRAYFSEETKALLDKGENIDNYKTILNEYKTAYKIREEKISNLYQEINKIKKLKV